MDVEVNVTNAVRDSAQIVHFALTAVPEEQQVLQQLQQQQEEEPIEEEQQEQEVSHAPLIDL